MANGWWNNNGAIAGCVAAYQPIGAADLAASYVNLFNPGTNNAAPGTAPTWDVTDGWIFGGTNYLNTGIVPADSYSVFVRFTNGGVDKFLISSLKSSAPTCYFELNPKYSNDIYTVTKQHPIHPQ
jgi:hypothetical protein